MATLDTDIAVQISLDAPPITGAGFGTVLLAVLAASLGVGFTERVRFYESAADGAADADLSSTVQDAIDVAFSQSPTPLRVAIGRLTTLGAEVATVTITNVDAGDDGDDWIAQVGDLEATYTQGIGDAIADVAAGLGAAIHALANASAAIASPVITVTGANAGEDLGIVVTPPAAGTATVATTTPAVTVGDGLDAILASEGNWYGLCLESRSAWDIMAAAAFAEANGRLFIAQSNDAAVASGAYAVDATDVASKLRQRAYTHTVPFFYTVDAEWADVAWACNRLAVDPDRGTTIWKFVSLAGIPTDAGNVTATGKSNVLGKYANLYLTFFGQNATGNGTVANGTKVDLIVTADWLKARAQEAFAQLFLDASARGEKIPYTDEGFAAFASAARGVLRRGVNAGHFVDGTEFITMPELKDVSSIARAARALSFTFGAQPAGAVETVSVTGYVSLDI